MMLEKELSCYKRCPPNQNILADEYLEDRKLMVAWCHRLCDGCNFKSELVQSAMALADKYMSSPNLFSYTKAHYQLIVITCLSISMKLDSPATAPSSKNISDMCRGTYTREEIESEEMCVVQTLAWYLNPPTASQIASHVLSLASPVAGVVSDWAGFVGRVHDLINASLADLGVSVLRPSTVALASILVSVQDIRDPCERQAVLRATLSIMNRFNFESPSEIDLTRTDLSFLARKIGRVDYTSSLPISRMSHDPTHTVSPQSVHQQPEVPVHSAYAPSSYGPARFEEQSQQDFRGIIQQPRVATQASSELSGQQACFCSLVNPEASNRASESMQAQPTARCAESTQTCAASSSSSSSSSSMPLSNEEDDLGSLSLDRGYSDNHYKPLLSLKISEERRLQRLSFHSSSADAALNTIPEYVVLDEFGIEDELLSLGVSTLSLR